jgi:hypothetical protein
MTSGLRSAIETLGLTVTGLSENNFFFDKAPEGTVYPHVIYSEIANTVSWDSVNVYEDNYFQFDIRTAGKETELDDAETLEAAITSKFDFTTSLSVTGYNVILCFRQGTRKKTRFPDSDVWQIILEYRVELSKGR